MMKFCFGFDLENIKKVMDYVVENYNIDEYKMSVGYGDDVMNYLEIVDKNDERLMDLINECDECEEE